MSREPKIHPRSDGGYRVVYYDDRGARTYRSFRLEAEAQAFLEALGRDPGLGSAPPRVDLKSACQAYLRAEGPRLAKITVQNRASLLARIIRYLPEGSSPDALSATKAEEYLADLARAGCRGTSLNAIKLALAPVWAWFLDHEWAKENPWRQVRSYKAEPRRPGLVPPDRVREYLDACPAAFRVPAALAVYAGLRRREVVELQWWRVDLRRGWIQIDQSKARRPRRVPLHPELRVILEQIPRRSEHVALTYYGKPYTGTGHALAEMAGQVGRSIGLSRVTFHGLRATCATLLAESGAGQVTIQAILGHSRETMTWRYTCATDPAVETAMSRMTVPELCRDCAEDDVGRAAEPQWIDSKRRS